jgi:diguanylate cyclase (GGDEF)-like protein/PAS domain S-box-containing protein
MPPSTFPHRIALWLAVIGAAVVLGGGAKLLPLQIPGYASLHTALEAVAFAFSLQIAVTAWFRSETQRPLRLLALGMFAVALCDLGHLLSFPGMPGIAGLIGFEVSLAFWYAARWGTGLVLALLLLPAAMQRRLAVPFAVLAALPLLTLALADGRLPPLWSADHGVGALKVAADWSVALGYLLLARLWLRGEPPLRGDLVGGGLVVLSVGELMFIDYAFPDQSITALGHLYKLAGLAFLLRAVVLAHVVQPYRDLLREKRAREISAEQVERLISGAPDGILVVAGNGRILAVNPAAERQFRGSRAELLALSVDDLTPQSLRDAHRRHRDRYHQHATVRPMSEAQSLKARRLDGSSFYVDISLSPLRWQEQHCAVAFVRDSTIRVEQMQRLDWLSAHDELTGLPNRWALLRELSGRYAQGLRGACALFDVDNLGRINDALGHDIGDQLLRAVAGRLEQQRRPGEYLARLESDKFVLLLAIEDDQRAWIENVLASLNRPIVLASDLRLDLSTTAGFCRFPDDAGTPEALLQAAEVAMADAKHARRRGIGEFDPLLQQRGRHWLDIANRLPEALEHNEFRLVYQPRVALSGRQRNGFEALLRWRRAGVDVPPGEFIQVAEETGFILILGRWVIAETIAQARRWRDAGSDPGRLALNISARQLADLDLPAYIGAELQRHGRHASEFEVEVTETVAMENLEWALQRLEALSAIGLGLALDDFGTGYSSLAYLQQLPVDVLKIDLRFVQAIGCPDGETLLRTILGLANGLGKLTVAEGVETAEQHAWLDRHGCDQAQGYYYGRPMEADQVHRLLAPLPSIALPTRSPQA